MTRAVCRFDSDRFLAELRSLVAEIQERAETVRRRDGEAAYRDAERAHMLACWRGLQDLPRTTLDGRFEVCYYLPHDGVGNSLVCAGCAGDWLVKGKGGVIDELVLLVHHGGVELECEGCGTPAARAVEE